MKFAIIRTGGKQYKVSEGSVLEVERLPIPVNDTYSFSDVLLFADGEKIEIGTPLLNNLTVSATIIENLKGKKLRVSKFKAKARLRRVTGHRQSLTKVRIESVGAEQKTEKKKESLEAKISTKKSRIKKVKK